MKPSRAVMPMVKPEYMEPILSSLGRVGSVYDCMLMVCSPYSFEPKVLHKVVRLRDEHAHLLRRFWAEERGREISIEEAKTLLAKPTFAILDGGRILSIANTLAVTPDSSMVGGVYMVPEFRHKGLATSVTSKATD